MTVEEAEEYRRASQRYVKANMGMWSGRDVLPWYKRIPLAPVYGLAFMWLCVKGVPINVQKLSEKDYEPDEPELTKCPQCGKLDEREVSISVKVDK